MRVKVIEIKKNGTTKEWICRSDEHADRLIERRKNTLPPDTKTTFEREDMD